MYEFLKKLSLRLAVFSFLYLKKIKISKIYVGFGKFQKYTPVALWGATGLKCNFFFFKFAMKSLEKKKEGACRPLGGRQGPLCQYCKLEQLIPFFFFRKYYSEIA